jgi:hypothetical protein
MPNTRKHIWARSFELPAKMPLAPLTPYQRCGCGVCAECRSDEKWDRAFARFEAKEEHWDTKGLFQSTLRGR